MSKFLKVQFFGANISSTMTSLKVLEGPGPKEISCRAGPTRVFKMAARSNENLSFVCISLVFFLIFRQVESNKIRGVAVTSKFVFFNCSNYKAGLSFRLLSAGSTVPDLISNIVQCLSISIFVSQMLAKLFKHLLKIYIRSVHYIIHIRYSEFFAILFDSKWNVNR